MTARGAIAQSRRGATLIEMMVSCGLFSVFMVVSVGLFTSMTRVVSKEQQPAERLAEARVAALTIARRFRNCSAFVKPSLWQVVQHPTDRLMLRDGVLEKTVEFELVNGVLRETYYRADYDPAKPKTTEPIKSLRLTEARSFRVVGGGIAHPTRLTIELTTTDDRTVRAVTNLREAI